VAARHCLALLAGGDLEVVGRLADASNAAFLARVGAGSGGVPAVPAIYKPVAGEQPLWDFPDGHLAYREVAAWAVSAAGGWDVVPETVLRDGPLGPGSVQRWVGDPEQVPEYVVTVAEPGAVPPGWLPVLSGVGAHGEPVVVAHADLPALASVAIFDAVINNSDRKGSHLVREGDVVRGFDHGVSLHAADKLRTVLWGWAGQPLPAAEHDRLSRLQMLLADDGSTLSRQLEALLMDEEVRALRARVERLLEHAAYPVPTKGWPAIPWPPL
jgi:uncharacterized repeat protein (TIGR03843 family)